MLVKVVTIAVAGMLAASMLRMLSLRAEKARAKVRQQARTSHSRVSRPVELVRDPDSGVYSPRDW